MSASRTKAVTFEEFSRRGGGGGPHGEGPEPLLGGIWKRWAGNLVTEKIVFLESVPHLTPQQYVNLQALKAEFERVTDSTAAACQYLERQSRIFPFLKPLAAI